MSFSKMFVMRFNVPDNNCSAMSGWSHRLQVEGIYLYSVELLCLSQGHNTVVPVGVEPRTS